MITEAATHIFDSPRQLDNILGRLALLVGVVSLRELVVRLLNEHYCVVIGLLIRVSDVDARESDLGLVELDTRLLSAAIFKSLAHLLLHLSDGLLRSVDTIVATQVPESDVVVAGRSETSALSTYGLTPSSLTRSRID